MTGPVKRQGPLYAFQGDVFFTRSTSLLGRLIRWAETEPGEGRTWTNHTGVVVKDGWLVPPLIGSYPDELAVVVESLWHTERQEWWTAHRKEVLQGQRIRAFGPREPRTRDEREAFLRVAHSFVGDRYGWWKLIGFLVKRATKGKIDPTQAYFIDSRPICSYTAAKSEAAQGMWFGMEPQAADPDEMLDYCESEEGQRFWLRR